MTSSHTPTEPNSDSNQQRINPVDEDESTASQEIVMPLANLSGRTLSHFQLYEQLGAGAMSSVYRATDQRDDRSVALKVLLPGADGVARSRFRQEADTALQLDHPHIIRSFEIGETEPEGFAFIAMELVDGSSLADLLEQHRQISIVDSCLILEQVARGLDYAHRRGIVHRDVKPSNILLQQADDDDENAIHLSMLAHPVVPLLSDFGIARALDAPELTTIGRTVGTPSYMAPEQCSGSHEIDGRADTYALGTVFYRCLVGRPPFVGSTTQVLYAHVYNPLTIPDEVLVNLPMPIIDILRRSLAKNPRQRYATAAGMAIDMARITGGIQQPPPQGPVDLDEITATMTALPTADRTQSSSTVLIPARVAEEANAADGQLSQGTASRGRRSSETVQKRASREMNRLAAGIGLAAVALLLVFTIAAVRFLVQGAEPFTALFAGLDAEPTVAAIGDSGDEGDVLDQAEDVTSAGEEPRGEVEEEPAKAQETPTPVPTPVFDAPTVWKAAEAFYIDRDWPHTLEQLVALFRTNSDFNQQLAEYEGPEMQLAIDLLLSQPEHPFWQENADLYDHATVEGMLFETLIGLAADANASRQAAMAANHLSQAEMLRPDDEGIRTLAQATNAVVNATAITAPQARDSLHIAYVDYATAMEQRGDMCRAAEHLFAAQNLQVNHALNTTLSRYQDSCANDTIVIEAEPALAQLSGWLLYSAEGEDEDQIFITRVGSDGSSAVVLNGATLPSLSPDGSRLAYFSTNDDRPGLFALDVGESFPAALPDADRTGLRLTNFFEDGGEAPLAWASDNDRIAFGSLRESDRLSRVYAGWSGDQKSSRDISAGADPAWRPGQETIVHNGVDRTANQPGLWLRGSDGVELGRLTLVKEDLRPTWSPDGDQVVFTSSGRDGNWEIYRLDFNEMSVQRLTNNPSIDVAPTVSPDGEHVAFFSNRDGAWAIWVTRIDGGRVWRLAGIAGTISDWRAHSIQWVE